MQRLLLREGREGKQQEEKALAFCKGGIVHTHRENT